MATVHIVERCGFCEKVIPHHSDRAAHVNAACNVNDPTYQRINATHLARVAKHPYNAN